MCTLSKIDLVVERIEKSLKKCEFSDFLLSNIKTTGLYTDFFVLRSSIWFTWYPLSRHPIVSSNFQVPMKIFTTINDYIIFHTVQVVNPFIHLFDIALPCICCVDYYVDRL